MLTFVRKQKKTEVMVQKDRYIRFDWAVKRLLRNKANFGVLEGFLTVLLGEPIRIVEILESEGNQQRENDKFNRVDIKARNSKDEIIIVEVQNTREIYYLERILFGVAKAITEHIELGELYSEVKKVYSISILYFDIGKGNDYLYHGQNSFVGVHTGDFLEVTTKEKDAIVRKFKRAVTDSDGVVRFDRETKPGVSNLMCIYSTFTGKSNDEIAAEFEGKGYGDFKLAVAEVTADALAPVQAEYGRILADKAYVDEVLKNGAERASRLANRTVSKVYRKVGLLQLDK